MVRYKKTVEFLQVKVKIQLRELRSLGTELGIFGILEKVLKKKCTFVNQKSKCFFLGIVCQKISRQNEGTSGLLGQNVNKLSRKFFACFVILIDPKLVGTSSGTYQV